uniref:Aquaporin n=1 Tax=Ditylenchus dipsaci TaxID=166011 RepID=A0A915DWZ8_9BILA
MIENWRHKLLIPNKLARGALGEFFGTFLLVFIGDCIVAQTVLSGKVTAHATNAWININVGWGFAIVFCILVVGRSSGGHINPAVTVLLYTFGAVNALTTVVYCIAQTVGAFFGAAAVYLYYYDAMNAYHQDLYTNPRKYFGISVGNSANWLEQLNAADKLKYMHLTAGMYCSFPQFYLSLGGAFVDQMVGTLILCLFIAAIIDKRNEIPAHLHALMFGFVVIMIGCSLGMNVGYPINPARDFGPRRAHPTYFLMPILGPLVGGVLGGWIYYLFSGFQIVTPEEAAAHKNHGHAGSNIAHHKEEATILLSKQEDTAVKNA